MNFILRLLGFSDPVQDLQYMLRGAAENPLQEVDLDVEEIPEGYPANTRRFFNTRVSIFYVETEREDHKRATTINMVAWQRRGSIVMTFVDDELVTWTRNGITVRNPSPPPHIKLLVQQLLRDVRMAAESSE